MNNISDMNNISNSESKSIYYDKIYFYFMTMQ